MEFYYHSRMGKAWQIAYHAILTGLEELRPAFPVPRLEMEALGQILFQLRLDHPEIFYVTGFSCRVHPAASTVEFLPQYLFDKGKIREHQRAMSARIAKLARPAMDGVSVCEGIAKAVKALCDALGLWCIVVISENNPGKGIRYRHAWNIVRIGGQYYHLDATFDNSLGGDGVIRYDYFNLDDKKIFRDHEPILTHAPACTQGDRFFYREQKLSFTKQEEVGRRALQAIRKKKPLIFHWRGGYLTRDVLGELVALLERTAQEKGLHAQVKVNWPQAVLQVSFVPQPPGSALTPQQANEGEDAPAPLDEPLPPL